MLDKQSSIALAEVLLQQSPSPKVVPWRARQYADGKPRPLFRGMLHGLLACLLLGAIALCITVWHSMPLTLGFTGKLLTYGASAVFHLYPYSSTANLTKAFVVDLISVPFSMCGSVVAFAADKDSGTYVRELILAASTIGLNAIAVLWQTQGQLGLQTRSDRSDTPRSVIISAYLAWSFIFMGDVAGFDVLWVLMLGVTLLAAVLAHPVTKEHAKEPSLKWVPWHVRGMWSLHEDFHVALACADACWLAKLLLQAHRRSQTI